MDFKAKKKNIAAFQEDENNHYERIGIWFALGAAALAAAATIGFAVYSHLSASSDAETMDAQHMAHQHGSIPADEEEAANVAAANGAVQTEGMVAPADKLAADESVIIIEDNVIKFYFASGTSAPAEGADETAKMVVEAVKQGKKVVITGYADSSGSAELNAKLSKERAFNVRDLLLGAGVPEDSIEMKKPENITGSGNAAEARRVEVILQ